MIEQINNHSAQALERLLEQYKRAGDFKALLNAINDQIQALEDAAFEMKDGRSIYNAVGAQLDAWGEILNTSRQGLSDDEYRIILLGQVAVNNSKGTPEDLITIFNIFTRSIYVSYNEIWPAAVQLTAVGGNPLGDVNQIKDAIRRACPAGVSIDLFLTAPGVPFVFQGDPDPQGRGFGDLSDPDVGGFFVSIF